MTDLADAYNSARARVEKLTRSLGPERLRIKVPACSAWTVKDLTGHLVGVARAYATGDIPHRPGSSAEAAASWSDPEVGLRRDAWTAAHVDTRRPLPLEAILNEWDHYATLLDPMLQGSQPWPDGMPAWSGFSLVADIGTHEQDLRGALGEPGARDSAAAVVSLQAFSVILGMRLDHGAIPALRVRTKSDEVTEQVLGTSEPAGTIEGEWFEILRALSGRRTREQMRPLFVEGSPEVYLEVLTPYPPPEEPIVE